MLGKACVFVVALLVTLAGALFCNTAPGFAAGASSATASEVREEWLGVYFSGSKIGYATSVTEPVEGGYRIREEVNAAFNQMGAVQEMNILDESFVDEMLVLKRFLFRLRTSEAMMEVSGRVEDGALALKVSSAGSVRELRLPVDGEPRLASSLNLIMKKRGIRLGDRFTLNFFSPSTLSNERMDVTVEAEEDFKLGDRLLPAYRLRLDFQGVSETCWMSLEAGTLKSIDPMGFMLIRQTKEEAMRPPEDGYEPPDIVAMSSVPVAGNLPVPRNARFMKMRFSGADVGGMEVDGLRQSFRDDVLSVTCEDLSRIKSELLPVEDDALKEYLLPTPFVQSDDRRIVDKAFEIIGGEVEAVGAARFINRWVYENLDKVPSAGMPNAAETLDQLGGDCNEHAVLFAALARAVGIPTRQSIGLVMLNGRLYYHAWAEVYVGEWVAADPVFGQFPADATHIRLVYGGPEKQVAIIKLVGKLEAELLESR